ncbi:hypothetical protein SBRCBS47491_009084 [Sporothrix bragantina]|uniref:chitinase n=1 Tax=Sporothrix bragantina TaxID=671064 RepID=A0ABP0CRS1_9PEZI
MSANWTRYHDIHLLKSCDRDLLFDMHVGFGSSSAVAIALGHLKDYLANNTLCGYTVLFATSGDSVVGTYVGQQFQKDSAVGLAGMLEKLVKYGNVDSLEVCDADKGASKTVGYVSGTFDSLAAVQTTVGIWANSSCALTASSNPYSSSDASVVFIDTGSSSGNDASTSGGSNSLLAGFSALKPQADGTCATYTVGPKDICYTIGKSHSISPDDIEKFNSNTWGWAGCNALQLYQVICVSAGDPPMPAPVKNAQCGPQKPGTQRPTNGTKLQNLNPCPLNACCDDWGWCGTTWQRLHEQLRHDGGELRAKNGSGDAGYFEDWNYNRACLFMSLADIDTSAYSHIHFAFGNISADYSINAGDEVTDNQFLAFTALRDVKRIVSFGGWAFSTDPATYNIFRQGVAVGNRDKLANSVGAFVDGANYLEFLKLVRKRIGKDKSLSMALPASYWYLKQFPVKEMADVVDYFIYMTYDLHGQWDYNNTNALPGCPSGKCIRSHVNETETHGALAMLTKAGVPTNKIIVGLSSYGRSFHLADASCRGYQCEFTGSRFYSVAQPGVCTGTRGYIADAEIREIVTDTDDYAVLEAYHDEGSSSDVLVYGSKDSVDMVYWMDIPTKVQRFQYAVLNNFAGTTDWAVDLGQYYYRSNDPDVGNFLYAAYDNQCLSSECPATLDDLAAAVDTGSIKPVSLDNAFNDYNNGVVQGYDDVWGDYQKWVVDSVGPALEDYMDFTNGSGVKYFDYADGFHAAVLKDLGIDKNWIQLGMLDAPGTCSDPQSPADPSMGGGSPHGGGCDTGGSNCQGSGAPPACTPVTRRREGFPVAAANIDVPDPKDVITAAQANLTELEASLFAGFADLALREYTGDPSDIVVASGMPVFMLQDAIDNVKQSKAIGRQLHDEKKDLILLIPGILLIVLPIVGETVGAAFGGAATVDHIAALSAYDIVPGPHVGRRCDTGSTSGRGRHRCQGNRGVVWRRRQGSTPAVAR